MKTAILAATLLSLPAALAADCQVRVVLQGGRVIKADGLRTAGGVAYLALGGGEIGFPESHVLRVDPCAGAGPADEPESERRAPRPRRAGPTGTRRSPPAREPAPERAEDAPDLDAAGEAADNALPEEDPGPVSPLADPEEALSYLRDRVARWAPESGFAKEDVNLDRARYDQVVETLRYRVPRWEPTSDFLDEDAMQILVRDEGALDVLRRDVPRWRPASTFLDEDDLLDLPEE